eukprot:3299517-Rhodomonas_salina.1
MPVLHLPDASSRLSTPFLPPSHSGNDHATQQRSAKSPPHSGHSVSRNLLRSSATLRLRARLDMPPNPPDQVPCRGPDDTLVVRELRYGREEEGGEEWVGWEGCLI